MDQIEGLDRHAGDAVTVDEFQMAIDWLELNVESVKAAGVKTGGRSIKSLIKTLRDILGLSVASDQKLSRVKLPKKKKKKHQKHHLDPDYLYSASIQANNLLRHWADRQEYLLYPIISRSGDYIRVEWAEMPLGQKIQAPRRVWVLVRRWWDEYVDIFFQGMSSMAELMGVGLCIRTVDQDDDIPKVIEQIAREHISSRETVSIVSILGNLSDDVGMSPEIYRARQYIVDQHEGRLFITTVGHNGSDIRLRNEEVGAKLAGRMLKDLAATSQLEGKVVIFGASHKDKDPADAHRVRRKSFRNTVNGRRTEKDRPGYGHRLELPDHPELPDLDRDLIFDPMASWEMKKRLLDYLNSPAGPEVRAVYSQTTLLTLGAAQAIQEAGRPDILLYAEYISPSLLRWLRDENWPLAAVCGVDPYHYGRLVLRVAATRTEDVLRPIVIPPVLIGREDVRGDQRLTYMVELPRVFPQQDIVLETLDLATTDAVSKDGWYKKLFEQMRLSRARAKA
jgi:hypothetical protein